MIAVTSYENDLLPTSNHTMYTNKMGVYLKVAKHYRNSYPPSSLSFK